jgi:hypothetical protein
MSCMGLSFDLVSPDFESLRRALPALCPIVDRGARCGVAGYVGEYPRLNLNFAQDVRNS